MTYKPKNAAGFTLVELAISLVVIGLLIGGILKGKELLDNSKVTAFIRQIHEYDSAAMVFYTSYGALPGDITNPSERLPECDAALCNRGGNGNTKIRVADTTPANMETFNFFPHLTKAGLIKGVEGGDADTTSTSLPRSTTKNFFPDTNLKMEVVVKSYQASSQIEDIRNEYQIPGYHLDYGLAPHRMLTLQQIDRKLDDGMPYTGNVFVSGNMASDCPTANPGDGTQVYNISGTARRRCILHISAEF